MTAAIGIIAAVLTTACWGPQLVRTLRRGTAEDFAWIYLGMLTIGVFCWMLYGVLRADPVIWVANAFVTASALVVVVVKVRSRHLTIEGVEFVVPGVADPFNALESLVTVGPALAADLRAVGIPDVDTLRTVGIDEANRRLRQAGLGEGPAGGGAFSGPRWTGRASGSTPRTTEDPPQNPAN